MPAPFASISTLSVASAGTLNVNNNVSDRPTGIDSMNHEPSLPKMINIEWMNKTINLTNECSL
jgi:hypothetical protein